MPQNLFNWSNHTWSLIDQIGILLGIIASIIPLVGVIAAIWAYVHKEKIKQWLTRNQFPHIGEISDKDLQWDGLLFTVSKEDTPLWVIDSHRPDVIALLASTQSAHIAEAIQQSAESQGIHVIKPIIIKDADDIKAAQQATLQLINSLREQGCKNMGVDITGGKITMSLGAFMAAEEEKLSSLYVSSKFDHTLKKIDMRTAKLISVSKPN